MTNSLKKTPNAVSVLTLLIKKLSISVTSFTVSREVQEHPDYPSMLSLSDCLASWNIPNQAFKINKLDCDVEDLPFPFIAHVKIDSGQFFLMNGINRDVFSYSNEKARNGTISKDDFLKHWDGVILYAEKDEESGEPHYKQSLVKGIANRARIPFLICILLTSLIFAVGQHSLSLHYLLMFLITLSGVIVSTLLLMHSINANNAFIQNLCSLGRKNDCNAILKTDAAKVTSWLSWSEVGLFYFTGSLICLILQPASMSLLSWLNLFSLPYTIYSIGYQIRIKNWCVLCCAVQILLWAQAIVFFTNDYTFNFSYPDHLPGFMASCILCFLFPIAFWSFIKPLFVRSEELTPLKNQLKKFKYNTSLFNKLLSSQQKYDVSDELKPILMGNPDAEIVITMVSNPFCGPCAGVHKTLDNWIRQRDDIQVKVIFAASNEDTDQRTKVAKHAMALGSSKPEMAVEALNAWYLQEDKNYEKWAAVYPVDFDEEIKIAAKKQRDWCDATEIAFTPTILVNGFKLIEPYKLEDIKYFLGL